MVLFYMSERFKTYPSIWSTSKLRFVVLCMMHVLITSENEGLYGECESWYLNGQIHI